ncbi:hypothetical protein RRG08_003097 [Elysia crispata]|uniref:Uncharacterized protein n=1 Tax=Elysia crispata TaxID=231223 RepID=A0AAE1B874_9GAST|nr:hypothetical protein RRG08_003097 [Elysia crispata]
MFYHLAKKYNVVIEQKFLLIGHTQMECDFIHSTIERKITCDVFTPSEYAILFRTARRKPQAYTLTEIEHNQPFKLNGSYFTSICPGKTTGDGTVGELKAIKYKTRAIHYKLSHSGDWNLLPQRIREVELGTIQLFQHQLPLTQRKFNDVMSMVRIMPIQTRRYFEKSPSSVMFYCTLEAKHFFCFLCLYCQCC